MQKRSAEGLYHPDLQFVYVVAGKKQSDYIFMIILYTN